MNEIQTAPEDHKAPWYYQVLQYTHCGRNDKEVRRSVFCSRRARLQLAVHSSVSQFMSSRDTYFKGIIDILSRSCQVQSIIQAYLQRAFLPAWQSVRPPLSSDYILEDTHWKASRTDFKVDLPFRFQVLQPHQLG